MNTLKNIISALFGGIITLLIYLRLKKPDTVINQRIGKVKQKGEGNLLDVDMKQFVSRKQMRKAKRKQRKAERKTERKAKKSVLSNTSKNTEI